MEDEEYIVEYLDGPLQGETDRRVFVDGRHDERISAFAAVEGTEPMLWYDAVETERIQGLLHVRYAFDAAASEPVSFDRDQQ